MDSRRLKKQKFTTNPGKKLACFGVKNLQFIIYEMSQPNVAYWSLVANVLSYIIYNIAGAFPGSG